MFLRNWGFSIIWYSCIQLCRRTREFLHIAPHFDQLEANHAQLIHEYLRSSALRVFARHSAINQRWVQTCFCYRSVRAISSHVLLHGQWISAFWRITATFARKFSLSWNAYLLCNYCILYAWTSANVSYCQSAWFPGPRRVTLSYSFCFGLSPHHLPKFTALYIARNFIRHFHAFN